MLTIKHLVSLVILLGVVYSTCPPSSLMTRTIDGSCNNLLFKNWGKEGTFYSTGPEGRETYAPQHHFQQYPQEQTTYADLDTLPSDGPRGNSRNISNVLCTRTQAEEDTVIDPVNHSMFSNIFGQFINHDLENNRFVNATSRAYFPLVTYVKDVQDSTCQSVFPPSIPDSGYRCNPENRVLVSEARISGGEVQSDGTRKIYNDATAYLDLNTVYGPTKETSDKLRSMTHGKLLVTEEHEITISDPNPMNNASFTYTFENFLPLYEDVQVPNDIAFIENTPWNFFVSAGDPRVNENIALTFFHNLFMREHNRICDELIENNLVWKLLPKLFDEVIFQKARQINIAQYQRIVYEQFFESAYGSANLEKLGNYNGYNPFTETSTSTVFASAAFRYGHFSMRNYFALNECGEAMRFGLPAADQNVKMEVLGMGAQQPAYIQPLGQLAMAGSWENIARGLINERTAPNGMSANSHIRDLRIPTRGMLDLITLDLQRARYNDLPNYQQIRKHYHGRDSTTNNIYGLPGCPKAMETNDNEPDPIKCFLAITSDSQLANKLRDLYTKVKHIDALIGMTAEDKVEGTSFSRTSANIIIDQFKRSRDGDRFFYKSLFTQGTLTHAEKQNIATVTMGDILRRNLDIDNVPDNPFVAPENYRATLQAQCN